MTFQFASLGDFLHMQGHGAFVWSAYALSLLIMVWLVGSSWLQQRRLRRQLQRQYRRQAERPASHLRGG